MFGTKSSRNLDHNLGLSVRPLGRSCLELTSQWKRFAWDLALCQGPFFKRAFDIVASLVGILLASPILLFVYLLVRLEDGGPGFYVQTRVGRRGKLFKMYKFRSMAVDSDSRVKDYFAKNKHARGVTFKLNNDPRLTRVGKRIRKLSLDELPQIFNILKGDMTFVGPRPPIPNEVKLYSVQERRRLEAKPGLTCFWQIEGRSDLDFPEQVLLDLRYIQNRSMWLDIKILFRTIPAVLTGRGAY